MNFLSLASKTPVFPNQRNCTRSALQGSTHLLAHPQYHLPSLLQHNNPHHRPAGIIANLSPFSRQSTGSLCNGNQSVCNSSPRFLNDLWRFVPHRRHSDCALPQRDLPQLRLPPAASGVGHPVRKGQRQRSRGLLVPRSFVSWHQPKRCCPHWRVQGCCQDCFVAAWRNSGERLSMSKLLGTVRHVFFCISPLIGKKIK